MKIALLWLQMLIKNVLYFIKMLIIWSKKVTKYPRKWMKLPQTILSKDNLTISDLLSRQIYSGCRQSATRNTWFWDQVQLLCSGHFSVVVSFVYRDLINTFKTSPTLSEIISYMWQSTNNPSLLWVFFYLQKYCRWRVSSAG